jgi:hypothetical protein
MKLGRFIKVIKVGILLNYCKTNRLIWVRITITMRKWLQKPNDNTKRFNLTYRRYERVIWDFLFGINLIPLSGTHCSTNLDVV